MVFVAWVLPLGDVNFFVYFVEGVQLFAVPVRWNKKYFFGYLSSFVSILI
jgi:hypothetical protein